MPMLPDGTQLPYPEDEEPAGDVAGADGGSALEHLRQAIFHAQAALQAEPDDIDSQTLAKVVQGLYTILAGRQKEQESMLGGGGNLRGLARSYGG